MNAALGIVQLSKIDTLLQRRNEIYRMYQQSQLKSESRLFGSASPLFTSNGYGFSVIVKARPDDSIAFANSHSVSCRRTFSDSIGYKYQDKYDRFPNAIAANTRAISFPLYPFLSKSDLESVQRVISHPTAVLYAEASDKSNVVNRGLRPFTPLYVYERGRGWLRVGIGTNRADGWIRADLTTPWNQALTLLFTNRSERDPVLFFKDMQSLRSICDAPDLSAQLAALQKAAAEKKPDPRIVAAEPADSSVALNRFYLMPILEMQEPYEGTKFLRVASIDPGKLADAGRGGAGGAAAAGPATTNPDGTKRIPKTGIAFVMDTTISMGPYIEKSRAIIKTIYDRLQKSNLTDHVGFAFVAFRNSTAAVPRLEYTSTIVSDFVTAKHRSDLESRLAHVKEAKVSTHSFDEDSLAGVYNAVESLSWQDYDSRIILLVTDAGPLPSNDPYASVAMQPSELNDFANQKGIWIVAVHVKTPAGAKDHDYAEQAYKELSMKNSRPQYQSIKARTPKEGARFFAAVADSLATTMTQMVTFTSQGKFMTRPKVETKSGTPEEEASVGLRGAFLCAALFSLLSAAIAPKLKKYVGGGAAAFFGEK